MGMRKNVNITVLFAVVTALAIASCRKTAPDGELSSKCALVKTKFQQSSRWIVQMSASIVASEYVAPIPQVWMITGDYEKHGKGYIRDIKCFGKFIVFEIFTASLDVNQAIVYRLEPFSLDDMIKDSRNNNLPD